MNPAMPNTEQLAAFVLGDLGGADAVNIENALQTNPQIATTVNSLRTIVETMRTDDTVTPSSFIVERVVQEMTRVTARDAATDSRTLVDRMREFIATLVFDSRTQPALAGFRGAAAAVQLAYEVDGATIDLQISPARSGDMLRVQGQISSSASHGVIPIRLVGESGEDVVEQFAADAHGRFKFEAPAGTYQLHLTIPDGTVIVPNLDVG